MHTPEEIASALQDAKLEEVAYETGLNYFTLVRYRAGKVRRPPHDSIRRLSAWIDGREKKGAA